MYPATAEDRQQFNRAAFNDQAFLQTLPADVRAKLEAVNQEERSRLAALERQRPNDLVEARKKAALEHPAPKLVPFGFMTPKTKEAIEQRATQIRDAEHVKKAAAVYAETDPQREQIMRDHEKSQRALASVANPGLEQDKAETDKPAPEKAASEWTPEATALYETLKARFEAERGNRDQDRSQDRGDRAG